MNKKQATTKNYNPISIGLCPLCNSHCIKSEPFLTWYMNIGKPFGISSCSSCSYIFLSPRPSNDLFATFYKSGTLSGYSGYDVNRYEHIIKSRGEQFQMNIRMLIQHLPEGGDILDVGSSSGEFLEYAKKAGLVPSGIDPDPHACKKAKEAGYKVVCCRVEEYLPTHRFDAIHLSHVVEHFYDPVKAVRKLYRILRPNGVLLSEVPNQLCNSYFRRDRFLGRIKQRERSGWSIHHISFFSPKTYKILFEKAGFKVMKIKSFDNIHPKLKRRIVRTISRRIFPGGGTHLIILAEKDNREKRKKE